MHTSNLGHDDGTAVTSQVWGDNLGNKLDKVAHVLLPLGVGVAEDNVGDPIQPTATSKY
jgi:hypothetical protein